MKSMIGIALALLFANKSEAKHYPKLTDYVEKNVSAISKTINDTAGNAPMDFGGNYEFKRILLRVQAKAGFDVEFGKIELIPELEFVFQKEPVS